MADKRNIYQRNRARVLSGEPVCWLCGKAIDTSIPWPDPLCGTADHVIPRTKGGSDAFSNLRPAHNICNQRKKDRDRDDLDVIITSRAW